MKKTLRIDELEARVAPTFGPPRIFLVLPTSGPSLMPIGIGGTNATELPLIGSISVGSALRAPADAASEHVDFAGLTSNRFPFTVN